MVLYRTCRSCSVHGGLYEEQPHKRLQWLSIVQNPKHHRHKDVLNYSTTTVERVINVRTGTFVGTTGQVPCCVK
jgi:hypothetical protein